MDNQAGRTACLATFKFSQPKSAGTDEAHENERDGDHGGARWVALVHFLVRFPAYKLCKFWDYAKHLEHK